MAKRKKISFAIIAAIVVLRLQNVIFGFSTLAKLLSTPPELIPELYTQDMLYFIITLGIIAVLLMVAFPKKAKYKDKRDKEMDKINRGAYDRDENPYTY